MLISCSDFFHKELLGEKVNENCLPICFLSTILLLHFANIDVDPNRTTQAQHYWVNENKGNDHSAKKPKR